MRISNICENDLQTRNRNDETEKVGITSKIAKSYRTIQPLNSVYTVTSPYVQSEALPILQGRIKVNRNTKQPNRTGIIPSFLPSEAQKLEDIARL